MTATDVQNPPPGAVPPRAARPWRAAAAALRLTGLHLAGRRVPGALAALAACGLVLRAALHWHWDPGPGPSAQELPVLIEAGAAALIAVTTYSPFGEAERATGRWLPYLRLASALALIVATVGALAAGAAAAGLSGGTVDVVRNVAGMAGIGLLSAALVGGSLAWAGPMSYLAVAETALLHGWTTPWTWPARAPHDHGAAVCAALVGAAGLAVITLRGARDSTRE